VIIDCHTHVFPPRIIQNRAEYAASDPGFALFYSSPSAKLATTDELIASMDRTGIDISVILNISWAQYEHCIETNDYILESIARYPRRLVGFGSVLPHVTEVAAKEIERLVSGGIKGIGEIRPPLFDSADEAVTTPVVEVLTKYKLVLLIHASEPVGHEYPGKGKITPEVLYSLITRLPDLSIICAHWGGGLPFYALMPEVKKALKNVYFDTAASPFLYRPEVYGHVIKLVGPEKVLFGSDYPLLSAKRLLKEINALELDGAARELILAGSAARLLGINREG
jgi:predicted TIM-barrel fold metal-dependent hydrolase